MDKQHTTTIGHNVTSTEELATIVRETLYDRLENSTRSELAFEIASLRAFTLQATDALIHLSGHLERSEITEQAQMLTSLQSVIKKLLNGLANLEDVRHELRALRRNNSE